MKPVPIFHVKHVDQRGLPLRRHCDIELQTFDSIACFLQGSDFARIARGELDPIALKTCFKAAICAA
jgi:hypothetical protein